MTDTQLWFNALDNDNTITSHVYMCLRQKSIPCSERIIAVTSGGFVAALADYRERGVILSRAFAVLLWTTGSLI